MLMFHSTNSDQTLKKFTNQFVPCKIISIFSQEHTDFSIYISIGCCIPEFLTPMSDVRGELNELGGSRVSNSWCNLSSRYLINSCASCCWYPLWHIIKHNTLTFSRLKMPEFRRVVPTLRKIFMWSYLNSCALATIEIMIYWIRVINSTFCVSI